ncbi:hypothetical protein RB195_023762 [Necator americanus]|uniref:Reverse transcriptase domain-containing protein n=1 Tax=Necator americanus TaxID=51031 RepID=A0ABR1ELB3_NECAM
MYPNHCYAGCHNNTIRVWNQASVPQNLQGMGYAAHLALPHPPAQCAQIATYVENTTFSGGYPAVSYAAAEIDFHRHPNFTSQAPQWAQSGHQQCVIAPQYGRSITGCYEQQRPNVPNITRPTLTMNTDNSDNTFHGLSILENATQNSAAAYTASWVSSTSSIPPELRDEPEVPSFIGSAHQDFHDHLVTVASTNFTAPVSSVTEQLSNISVRDKGQLMVMYKPPESNPTVDNKFRVFENEFATSVYSVLERFSRKHVNFNLTVAQRRGLREIRNLITAGEIKDDSLYVASSANEFRKQYRRLNRVWVETAGTAGLPKNFITRLKNDLPACPVLYTLIKTHKLSENGLTSNDPRDFKVRPITSVIGGPTDRISWLLNIILNQLLKYVPAHLSSSSNFLKHLRSTSFERECVVETFDVTSLYTNVSNDVAMQAVHELLTQRQASLNMYGFSIRQIMTLINECLNCSIFRWSGQYYRQLRGLAMGQRLAPTLAIVFMAKIEKPIIDRKPLLYCRYIDDCCVVCSTQADVCFNLLNQQCPHIKFTRERPIDNWLAFLNMHIYLRNGICKTKWYRKPSSKNILIHYLSAHPSKMKNSVIGNMYRTAARVSSSSQEKAWSINVAHKVAMSNGYPAGGGATRQARYPSRRPNVVDGPEKIPFCLPYISDDMSRAVRGCLRKAGLRNDVRVVEIPPANLKGQLVRNRVYDRLCTTPSCVVCPYGREGDCMISGVVYRITCRLCGDDYIGETGRPLCIRVKEHLDGLAKSKTFTPLGAHRRICHPNSEVEVYVRILSYESEITARRTLEGFWISAKSPKMNRKDECIAITNELSPYQDLCSDEGDIAETLAAV